jgi:hypothetical protein
MVARLIVRVQMMVYWRQVGVLSGNTRKRQY